jgi:SAM-dependent methyltransferase
MVERARQNLAAAPNAVVSRTNGSDLSGFADASIDFCYSYAVFQHIPEREVVLSSLREACRVLKPGGILKAQVNSLRRAGDPRPDPVPGWSARAGAPHSAVVVESTPDTWNGVSFCGEEIAAFAREQRLLLLALDGFDTQYLWFTARKPAGDEPECGPTLILGSSSTAGSDRVIPRDGRFSSAALWVDLLPRQADLIRLRSEVDGVQTAPSYISERTPVGASQVNFFLPPDSRSGALPLRLWMDGMPLSPLAAMLVAPSIPPIPRLLSVTDGVDLLSDIAIQSRSLKVHIEDVPLAHAPALADEFEALLERLPLKILGAFCVDPLARRYELNLEIPQDVPAGPYNLFCRLGARKFPPVALQITP